jgi:hypothetical protein
MSEGIHAKTEMAAEELSPLPFRVLWWRALISMLIGGLVGWFFCYGLGHLFFPTAFQDIRVEGELLGNSTSAFIAGGAAGLCSILSKGGTWPRAIASIICVWFGWTFFVIPLLFIITILFYLANGNMPQQSTTNPPTLMQLSPQLMAWSMVAPTIAGALLLHQSYKMHLAERRVEWLLNLRDGFSAIFKPQERHRLERFVLHSPLSLEECRARLAQIADVETSPFAFWEKLPLPGFKPLTVTDENNHWRFSGRYKKAGLTFHTHLTPIENGTQLHCVSRWIKAMKFNFLWNIACASLLFVVFALAAIAHLFAIALGYKTTSNLPIFGFLFMLAFWAILIVMLRLSFWHSRQQELMAIEAFEKAFEAQIIEREPVHYKWGLFEQP